MARAGILNTAAATGTTASTGLGNGTVVAPTTGASDLVIQQAQVLAEGDGETTALGLGALQFGNILGAYQSLVQNGTTTDSDPTSPNNVNAVTNLVNSKYANGGGEILTTDQVGEALSLLDQATRSLTRSNIITV
jgi:hypothetical protein